MTGCKNEHMLSTGADITEEVPGVTSFIIAHDYGGGGGGGDSGRSVLPPLPTHVPPRRFFFPSR